MNSLINLALIGASGVVGKKIISLLEKLKICVTELMGQKNLKIQKNVSFDYFGHFLGTLLFRLNILLAETYCYN